MEDPHLWDDPEEAQKKTKLLASLKEDVHGYDALVSSRDDIRDMIEMADEEPDPALVPEVQEMFDDFKNRGHGLDEHAVSYVYPLERSTRL